MILEFFGGWFPCLPLKQQENLKQEKRNKQKLGTFTWQISVFGQVELLRNVSSGSSTLEAETFGIQLPLNGADQPMEAYFQGFLEVWFSHRSLNYTYLGGEWESTNAKMYGSFERELLVEWWLMAEFWMICFPTSLVHIILKKKYRMEAEKKHFVKRKIIFYSKATCLAVPCQFSRVSHPRA